MDAAGGALDSFGAAEFLGAANAPSDPKFGIVDWSLKVIVERGYALPPAPSLVLNLPGAILADLSFASLPAVLLAAPPPQSAPIFP